MPKFLTSTIINAPLEKVWTVMRDFGALASYYGSVDTVILEGGSLGDQIGSVRTLRLKSGATLKEKLIAMSDADHWGSYEVMVEGTPFENMVSTYRLYPITDRQATYFAWATTFDIKGDESVGGFMKFLENDVYGSCFHGIRKLVGE